MPSRIKKYGGSVDTAYRKTKKNLANFDIEGVKEYGRVDYWANRDLRLA